MCSALRMPGWYTRNAALISLSMVAIQICFFNVSYIWYVEFSREERVTKKSDQGGRSKRLALLMARWKFMKHWSIPANGLHKWFLSQGFTCLLETPAGQTHDTVIHTMDRLMSISSSNQCYIKMNLYIFSKYLYFEYNLESQLVYRISVFHIFQCLVLQWEIEQCTTS